MNLTIGKAAEHMPNALPGSDFLVGGTTSASSSVATRTTTRTKPAITIAPAYHRATSMPLNSAASSGLQVPYAHRASSTAQQTTWQLTIARHWAQWHIALALVMLTCGTTLTITHVGSDAAFWLMGFALGIIACSAAALRALDYRSPAVAAIFILLCDGGVVLAGILVVGPQPVLLAFLPGALLVAALLVDPFVVITAGIILLVGFTTALINAQTAGHTTLVRLDGMAQMWLQTVSLAIGMLLLLVAIGLVVNQMHRAIAAEAALTYRLQALERRVDVQRQANNADAIALQTALMQALHARKDSPAIPPVETGEDLAPLAHMINAVTERVPALRRDREDRLQLERAIREVSEIVEQSVAGFEWSWPNRPTGTLADRLVAALRMSSGTTGTHPHTAL